MVPLGKRGGGAQCFPVSDPVFEWLLLSFAADLNHFQFSGSLISSFNPQIPQGRPEGPCGQLDHVRSRVPSLGFPQAHALLSVQRQPALRSSSHSGFVSTTGTTDEDNLDCSFLSLSPLSSHFPVCCSNQVLTKGICSNPISSMSVRRRVSSEKMTCKFYYTPPLIAAYQSRFQPNIADQILCMPGLGAHGKSFLLNTVPPSKIFLCLVNEKFKCKPYFNPSEKYIIKMNIRRMERKKKRGDLGAKGKEEGIRKPELY